MLLCEVQSLGQHADILHYCCSSLVPPAQQPLHLQNMYRIYYPTSNDPQYDLLHSAANPWWAPVCPLGA